MNISYNNDSYKVNYFFRRLLTESMRNKFDNHKLGRISPHMQNIDMYKKYERDTIIRKSISLNMFNIDDTIKKYNNDVDIKNFIEKNKNLMNGYNQITISGPESLLTEFEKNPNNHLNIFTTSIRKNSDETNNYLNININKPIYDNFHKIIDIFYEPYQIYIETRFDDGTIDEIIYAIVYGDYMKLNTYLDRNFYDEIRKFYLDLVSYLHMGEEPFTMQYCNYYDLFDNDNNNLYNEIFVVIVTSSNCVDSLRRIYPHFLILEQPDEIDGVGLTKHTALAYANILQLDKILLLDDNVADFIAYIDDEKVLVRKEANCSIITDKTKNILERNKILKIKKSRTFRSILKDFVWNKSEIKGKILTNPEIDDIKLNQSKYKISDNIGSINFNNIGYIGFGEQIWSDEWEYHGRNDGFFTDLLIENNMIMRIYNSGPNLNILTPLKQESINNSLSDHATRSVRNPHRSKAYILNLKILREKNINFNPLYTIGEDIDFTKKIILNGLITTQLNMKYIQPSLDRRPRACLTCVSGEKILNITDSSPIRGIMSDFYIYNGRHIMINSKGIYGASGVYGPLKILTTLLEKNLHITKECRSDFIKTGTIEGISIKYTRSGLEPTSMEVGYTHRARTGLDREYSRAGYTNPGIPLLDNNTLNKFQYDDYSDNANCAYVETMNVDFETSDDFRSVENDILYPSIGMKKYYKDYQYIDTKMHELFAIFMKENHFEEKLIFKLNNIKCDNSLLSKFYENMNANYTMAYYLLTSFSNFIKKTEYYRLRMTIDKKNLIKILI